MSTSLSSIVNNLSDGLYNDKCTDCKSCLEYILAKGNQLMFKCLKCNKNYNKYFTNDLINRFASTYEFCDKDINKFILLLRKGVYPYEYMNTKDPKGFMEYSNDTQDFYKNIEEYNPDKENKVLIVLDDVIVDMINNKKLNPVVTELFIRDRKLNISIVFITQSYFKVPKEVRLNTTHFFIM